MKSLITLKRMARTPRQAIGRWIYPTVQRAETH
jgi:hypothetical protein